MAPFPGLLLNPSTDKNGLALNIDMDNNALDYSLAKSTGTFFHLKEDEMDLIIREIRLVVSKWRSVAESLSISRSEQETMAQAFNTPFY